MEQEIVNQTPGFIDYLPYIVSILCSIITGITSYMAARKQSKSDLQKLMKQHELDIEKEREKFAMEKERMEIDHKHQLELLHKETENQLGSDLIGTMMKEFMRSPEGRSMMRNSGKKK